MKRHIILFVLCLHLTGCYQYVMRQASVNEEFKALKCEINNRTDGNLFWDFADKLSPEKKEKIDQMLKKGISRNDAINIALLNNRKIQTFMVNLGLAKSDVIQSQLFDNPLIYFFALFPKEKQMDGEKITSEIAIIPNINVANFWTVPFKAKVSKDALIVTNYEIIQEIFRTIQDTRKFYDATLWEQMRVNYMELIIQELSDLKKNAKLHWKQDELDDQKGIIDLQIAQWQISIIDFKMEYAIANAELQKMLGLRSFSNKPLKLTSDLRDAFVPIPNLKALEIKALICNPEIIRALAQIHLFEDKISLEKALVFNNFKLGVFYNREDDGVKLLGPNSEFELPLFDQNQGNIAKAYYNLEKAKRELIEVEVRVKAELRIAYFRLIFNRKQLNLYIQKIEESFKKISQHTLKFKTKALELIYIDLIRATRLEYLDNYKQTLDGLSELEKVVGQRLDLRLYKDPEFAKEVRKGKTLLPKEINLSSDINQK